MSFVVESLWIGMYICICNFCGSWRDPRSQAESFPLEVQEEEETFDLSLISALEIDVVPYLGDIRIPDYLVSQLGSILYQGSQLRKTIERPNGNVLQANGYPAIEKIEMNKHNEKGTTEVGSALPRERFSYWCFDLLFLVCSNTTKGTSRVTSLDFHWQLVM